MKIYIVEDKTVEIEKAKEAIKKSGHDIGRTLFNNFINKFNALENIHDPNWANCATSGMFSIITNAKKEGGGIITDMMFHLTTKLPDEPVPPSGILVVLQAISAGVPVVVCTDTSEVGGHHAKALHWIFDGYIVPARMNGIEIPFGWVENKDWDAAVKLLEQFHAKQNRKEVVE